MYATYAIDDYSFHDACTRVDRACLRGDAAAVSELLNSLRTACSRAVMSRSHSRRRRRTEDDTFTSRAMTHLVVVEMLRGTEDNRFRILRSAYVAGEKGIRILETILKPYLGARDAEAAERECRRRGVDTSRCPLVPVVVGQGQQGEEGALEPVRRRAEFLLDEVCDRGTARIIVSGPSLATDGRRPRRICVRPDMYRRGLAYPDVELLSLLSRAFHLPDWPLVCSCQAEEELVVSLENRALRFLDRSAAAATRAMTSGHDDVLDRDSVADMLNYAAGHPHDRLFGRLVHTFPNALSVRWLTTPGQRSGPRQQLDFASFIPSPGHLLPVLRRLSLCSAVAPSGDDAGSESKTKDCSEEKMVVAAPIVSVPETEQEQETNRRVAAEMARTVLREHHGNDAPLNILLRERRDLRALFPPDRIEFLAYGCDDIADKLMWTALYRTRSQEARMFVFRADPRLVASDDGVEGCVRAATGPGEPASRLPLHALCDSPACRNVNNRPLEWLRRYAVRSGDVGLERNVVLRWITS